MKPLNFTLIQLTFCYVVGIVLVYFFKVDTYSLFITCGILVVSLGIYWLLLKNKHNRKPYFACLVYVICIGFGMLVYKVQDQRLRAHHYSHFIKNKPYNALTFKVKERLKPNAYNQKYVINVLTLNGKPSSGKLLLNLSKDSLATALNVDNVVYTKTEIQQLKSPLNPYQFNYKAYLKRQQIHHQLYLKPQQVLVLPSTTQTVYGLTAKLRQTINQKLTQAGFKSEVLSIINALILGQKQDIDTDTYNNYINAGTIHILAVSGLHVGVLMVLLKLLLSPLLRLKHGRLLRPIIVTVCLWFFAFLAGLSPSVIRAVTMFSIVTLAGLLKRPSNIYNTLTFSAFVLLLVNPRLLFEVGFQLSYLAVFAIVSFQPLLYKLWQPKFKPLNKLWKVFTVTLAAQIGVAPIGLYYFHQFPGLFFVSNLIVVPALTFILGGGILVIILALCNGLKPFFVTLYTTIIEWLNGFIAWIAKFEAFIFKDISMSVLQLLLCYVIIFGCFQFFTLKRYKYLVFSLVAVIGLQGYLLVKKYDNNAEFVIFNKSRNSIIGQKQGKILNVFHNLDTLISKNNNALKNYKVGERITSINYDSLQYYYQHKNEKILVIDSLGVYKNLSFKPNYVLLVNSPKINLNRLIDSLKPKQIIADASNYKTYVTRWQTTCKTKKRPFHYTYENGVFIIE